MIAKGLCFGMCAVLFAAPAWAAEPAVTAVDQFALLEQRVAQLESLQSQVDALRRATGSPRQMVVNVEVIELDLTRCRSLGFEFGFSGRLGGRAAAADKLANVGMSDGVERIGLLGVLTALRRNGLARTIAEPTLVVTSGRPASFQSGGEFAVADEDKGTIAYKSFGTEVDVLATTIGDNKVRVNIRPRISDIDGAAGGDSKYPRLKVRSWDTACETSLGETIVLAGGSEDRVVANVSEGEDEATSQIREEIHDIKVVVLVTVEAVEALDKVAPPEAEVRRTSYEETLMAAVKKPQCVAKVYPVPDLPVWRVRPTGTAFDAGVLVAHLRTAVPAESWRDTGDGEGEIRPFARNGALVINQTEENHARIGAMLESLRRADEAQVIAQPEKKKDEPSTRAGESGNDAPRHGAEATCPCGGTCGSTGR